MSLQTRLTSLAQAVGADVKTAFTRLTAAEQAVAAKVTETNPNFVTGYRAAAGALPFATGGTFGSTVANASALLSDPNQAIASGTWTKVNLPTEIVDAGLNFNNTSGTVGGIEAFCYRVPSDGLYLALGKIRLVDGALTGPTNIAMGIHTSADAAEPSVEWTPLAATSGSAATRVVLDYQRMAFFSAGDMVRLYVYSNVAISLWAANFSITRLN